MDIDNILISSNISCGDKNYEYFIDYMDDNYKFKPLFIMLPITSGYVKSYNDKTKGMDFFNEDDNLSRNMMVLYQKFFSILHLNIRSLSKF